ncbi:hypothetical protein [Streptomyces sp. HB132]|uniref:hypothetical protein n=1 Tax=Streptomyces sp. HB132 TaxID=767388 RepID=UPI0019600B7D|nr:hypothetical protein [Streptomyces sp. HB132]MBM7439322.1 hypothetical protein [Streptomyces sp. HB132]
MNWTSSAWRILDVFADAAGPMRARDLSQSLDLPLKPKKTENTRHKLKRLVSPGVPAETEPDLFHAAPPVAALRSCHRPSRLPHWASGSRRW